MSETYEHLTGKITVFATVEAATPEDAEKVEKVFTEVRNNAVSSAEPGCLVYRVVRHGTKFASFEEYIDAAAVQHHISQQVVINAIGSMGTTVAVKQPLEMRFYSEVQ